MLSGKALFNNVMQCRHTAAFWWLGQISFIMKLGSTRLLIDPFLTERPDRNVPPLFLPVDASGKIDVVLGSHDHLDHIDPAAVPGLAQYTDAVFVTPRAHTERMLSLGVPANRFVGMNDGETINVAGITVHAVKSAHEFFDRTPDGLFPHLGYLISGAGKVVYFAGDTLWWDGLQTRLAGWEIDVAIVPINGRDANRYAADILGNMTYQEAADLVGGLSVNLSVPAHYDMFSANNEDPNLFVEYMRVKYPNHPVWVGPPTTRVTF